MKSIHILHLEDNIDDASLVAYWLSREGVTVDIQVVTAYDAYVLALETETFDLVLADGDVLGVDAESALALVLEKAPSTSFLCLSGLTDPNRAKRLIKAGADGVISKDHPTILVETVLRLVCSQPPKKPIDWSID